MCKITPPQHTRAHKSQTLCCLTRRAPAPLLQPARQDRLQLAALALEWEPIRPLRVMATVQRDVRTANREGLDYRATIYGLAAQLWF